MKLARLIGAAAVVYSWEERGCKGGYAGFHHFFNQLSGQSNYQSAACPKRQGPGSIELAEERQMSDRPLSSSTPIRSRRAGATRGEFRATVRDVLIGLAFVVATVLVWQQSAKYLALVADVVARTLVLSLFLLFVFPLLYGLVGRSLGITSLFWNDSPLTRFNAAAAVTVYLAVIAMLMFMSYTIDPNSNGARPERDVANRSDLRLMSWGDGSGVPAPGNNLVVVGTDNNNLLHIRILDQRGKRATDVDETKLLPAQAPAILALKEQLPGLLPPHLLTGAEKARVLGEVTSIVGQPFGNDDFPRLYGFLSLIGVPLLTLVVAPAIWPAWFPFVPRSAPRWQQTANGTPICSDVTRNPRDWGFGVVVWAAGVVFGLLVFTLGLLAAHSISHQIATFIGRHNVIDPQNRRLIFYLVFCATFVATYGFAGFVDSIYDGISAPVAICFFLALLAFSYALLDDLPEWYCSTVSGGFWKHPLVLPLLRLSLISILVVWFCAVNQDKFKLRFPNMADYYGNPVDVRNEIARFYVRQNHPVRPVPSQSGASGGAELIDDRAALAGWLLGVTGKATLAEVEKMEPAQRPKLAVVAVSGGATRSALWTAVVLDRLEQKIPGFSRHVRVVTGASGGMLGAAYYLKHCRDNSPQPFQTAPPAHPSAWVNEIPLASIEPVARFFALRDPWMALLPRTHTLFYHNDRGIRLDRDWAGIGFPLQSLVRLEQTGRIPSIILSPMIVEDGRRLLISNLDLSKLALTQGSALTVDSHQGYDQYPYSLSAIEFFRLFPEATCFSLATGVRMNATFPFVSPALNLPTEPPLRVVDAGYYDNYGVQIASAWLQKNRDWLYKYTSGVVLVQIRDSISQKERLDVADEPAGVWAALARGMQFFTSPLDGANSARYATTVFRNDQDVWEVSDIFNVRDPLNANSNIPQNGQLDRAFFTTVVFENSAGVSFCGRPPGSWPGDGPADGATVNVPLDWYLSDAERRALIDAIPADPPAGSDWSHADNRLTRIRDLFQKVDGPDGRERDWYLRQLEEAKNYERLVELKSWWG